MQTSDSVRVRLESEGRPWTMRGSFAAFVRERLAGASRPRRRMGDSREAQRPFGVSRRKTDETGDRSDEQWGNSVIGAGPAGLASAAELRRRGVPAVVLERADAVGASWRGRYDRLRLNTSRWFSKLPGGCYAPGTGVFPSRDEVVRYLEDYARDNALDVRLSTSVERIDRDGAAGSCARRPATSPPSTWSSRPATSTRRSCRTGPAASASAGRCCTRPSTATPSPTATATSSWSARAARAWRSPTTSPRAGRGGSGSRCGPRRTSSSARRWGPPSRSCSRACARSGPTAIVNFVRSKEIGDLTEYGLPVPEEGTFSRLRRLGVAPAIVDKVVIEAISERRIEIVAGVESLDETGVGSPTARAIEPDAVIAATGYRRGLEPMVGHLGVLDDEGAPRAFRGRAGGARPALRRLRAPARAAALRRASRPAGGEGDRRRAARERGPPRAAGARRSDRPPSTAFGRAEPGVSG